MKLKKFTVKLFKQVTDKYKVTTNDEKDKLIKRFFEKLLKQNFVDDENISGDEAFVYDIIGILARKKFSKNR